MSNRYRVPTLTAVLLLTAFAAGAPAQQKPASKPTPTPAPAEQAVDQREYDEAFYLRTTLRLFQNYTLPKGKVAHEVVSVLSDVQIDGTVRGDVGVTLGNATLGPTAVIEGQLLVVGGSVIVADGATVRRDIVVIGGGLTAPDNFAAGGEHVIIGTPVIGSWLHAMKPWFTRGLLLGRLIVPDIGWVWVAVGFIFFFGLLFNHMFARQVAACADTLERRPFGAFFVGLLAIILAGPLMMIVAATVIGLPFAIAAFIMLSVIGRLGVTRAIGRRIVTESNPADRGQAFRSYVLGAAILIVVLMVPVAGLLTWILMGIFAFGTATMTFLSSMRRERPAPQAPPVPPVPPVPPLSPSDQMPPAPPVPPVAAPPAAALTETPVFVSPPVAEATAAPPPQATGPVPTGDLLRYPRATFLDRLVAFALDAMLVAIVNGWLMSQMQLFVFRPGPDNSYLAYLFLYHVAFWTWKGTTLGGIIVNIKMVRTSGETPRFIDALVRGLSAIFSVAALFIGCLWMLNDPEKQMWHDKFAGTVVVKVPRDVALA